MRVAVYHANDDIRIEDRPVPAIGPGELLVRVRASGICGSDVMEWYRRPKAPLVLGHELAGDVAQLGDGASGVAVGDRVVVSHHVPCDSCRLCEAGHHTACETLRTTNLDPGGFAEYVRVPALQAAKGTLVLPENVTYEEATFVEPLGCVIRAHERVRSCFEAKLGPEATVLVLGAGVSGLLHIRLARAGGVSRVFAVDVSEYRLEAAKASGATTAWDARRLDADGHSADALASRLREANEGRLVDLVVLSTGAREAVEQGVACLEAGGVFMVFAPPPPGPDIPLPLLDLWRKDATVTTSYGAAPSDLAAALEAIASGRVRVDDLVTHRLPLDATGEGFRLVAEADRSIKVIVEP